MPIKLPSADSVFEQRPGLRPGRIASYDISGLAKGQIAAATGDVKELQGRAEGERGIAAGHQTEAQSHRLEGDTARIQGQSEMEFARGMGQTAMAEAKAVGEVGRGLAEAEGKVADSVGRAGQMIGRSIEHYAEAERVKRSSYEQAQASADRVLGVGKLDEDLANDHDYKDMGARYEALARQNHEAALARISDQRERELYDLKHRDDIQRLGSKARARANGLIQDEELAVGQKTLTDLRERYLKTDDPAVRAQVIESANGLIRGWNDKGYISDVKAGEFQRTWVTDMVETKVRALPASERLTAIRGFEGALIGSESSGRPEIMNEKGYVGLYQFGAPRLQHLGVYTPGAQEDMDSWSGTGKSANGKWTGTFRIPGFENVRTVNDFRASEDAQRAAWKIHQGKMNEEIVENGFDKFIGKQVGGVTVTQAGLHAALHLGGVGSTRTFLSGKGDPSDGATRISDYMRKFASAQPGADVAQFLPADRAQSIAHNSQAELARDARQAEHLVETKKRTAIEELNRQLENDIAMIADRGVGDENIKREAIVALAGEGKAKDWEADRNRASRIFTAVSLAPTARDSELGQVLDDMQPQPGSYGYAEDLKAYAQVAKRIEAIRELRAEDPALAVADMPTVRAAQAAAQYEEVAGEKRITPQSAQAVMRTSLAAQEGLGIINPQALPKHEARDLGAKLRVAYGSKDDAKVEALGKQIYNTYGPDLAPRVMKSVIEHASLPDRAHEASQEIVDFLMKPMMGQKPTLEELQRATTAIDADTTKAAVWGKGMPYNELLGQIYGDTAAAMGGPQAAPSPKAGTSKPAGPAKPTASKNADGTMSSNVSIKPEHTTALLVTRTMPDEVFDQSYGNGMAAYMRKRWAERTKREADLAPTPSAAPPAPEPAKSELPKGKQSEADQPKKKTVRLLKDENGEITGLEETLA